MRRLLPLIFVFTFYLFADAPWAPNVRVSVPTAWDTLNQGESAIAVFGDSIFSICNTAERGQIPIAPYAYSFDAGQIFNQVPFTDSNAGIIWHTDPLIGVDDSGHVHLLIQYSAEFMNHYFSRDGLTWIDTSRVNSALGVDKPWWVINKNEIYVAWQQTSGLQGIWLAISTDYGRTFSDQRIWNLRGITALCMDEMENLHLGLVDWYGSVHYRKSTDKGVTWSTPIFISNYDYNSGYGDRAAINSITATGDVVFMTWVDISRLNLDWDIRACRSTDGGVTWGTPFWLNDSLDGGQCKGWSHFDPYGGLHVIYYHSPDWPTSPSSDFSLRYQYSPDSGATFKPSIRVSDTAAPSHDTFLGEYHIIVSDSQYVYAQWADGRNSNYNDLYFSKALISEVTCGEEIGQKTGSNQLLSVPTFWHGNIILQVAQYRKPLEIKLYDSSGRLVKNIFSGIVKEPLQIRLRGFDIPSGVLFVKVTSEDVTEVRKVVNLR